MVKNDKDAVVITVPEKYRQDFLRHLLNSALTSSGLVGLAFFFISRWQSPDRAPYYGLLPAVVMLAVRLPVWIAARMDTWNYVIDSKGIRIHFSKNPAIRVGSRYLPSVEWDMPIDEVERSTFLGLPSLRLYTRKPNGTLKFRMSVIYESDDAGEVQRTVLPLIERYRKAAKKP